MPAPNGRRSVWGVAVLDDEVFLVRHATPEVEVYDADALTLRRLLAVPGLVRPWDMTSCRRHRCLYVADLDTNSVHRVEPSNDDVDDDGSTTTTTSTRWSVDDKPEGLSVVTGSGFDGGANVIVACDRARKLKEYTTRGVFVREVRFPVDLTSPWHAVAVPHRRPSTDDGGGRFVVCHGWGSDPLHCVCVVDAAAAGSAADVVRVRQSYGGPPGAADGQLSSPARLAVDRRGRVIVADYNNNRVLLLSRSLDDVTVLVTESDVGRSLRPGRLCLDDERARLYVSDDSGRDVLVFYVRTECQ